MNNPQLIPMRKWFVFATAIVFAVAIMTTIPLNGFIVPSTALAQQQRISSNTSSSENTNSSNQTSDVSNENGSSHTNPQIVSVFSSGSKPYNLTYGEWTAKWWQWGYSIPKNINPAYDNTGKNCAEGQNGPVWFLAGTYGHPVERACTIPADKGILFPILNSECSFAEFPKLKTLSELRMCAKTIQDQATTLFASVDGLPIRHLQEYRIQSPPFDFTLPQNNILGMPANTTTQAIADGNWVFLKPLSPGIHKIMFKGGIQQPKIGETSSVSGSFAFPSGWNFTTIYDVTVKKFTNGQP